MGAQTRIAQLYCLFFNDTKYAIYYVYLQKTMYLGIESRFFYRFYEIR